MVEIHKRHYLDIYLNLIKMEHLTCSKCTWNCNSDILVVSIIM